MPSYANTCPFVLLGSFISFCLSDFQEALIGSWVRLGASCCLGTSLLQHVRSESWAVLARLTCACCAVRYQELG